MNVSTARATKRIRGFLPQVVIGTAIFFTLGAGASAGPDEGDPPAEDSQPTEAADNPCAANDEPAAPAAEKSALTGPVVPRWGVGVRLRYVGVPAGVLELFWEKVASGAGNVGFGVEAVRRRGDFEINIGLEYESLSGSDGYWQEKDRAATSAGAVDEVKFDGFGWLTVDASFIYLKPLNDKFYFRAGGGFGLGIVIGEVTRSDALCSSDDINGGACATVGAPDPEDIPPVLPVINGHLGIQYRHDDKISANFELGLRTAMYLGLSGSYMF